MSATITLNDGRALPTLAFGTGTALYDKDASDAVVQALDNGFVHIDCAAMYSNEETVGAALKKWGGKREDVFITTKVGGKDARKSLEASLSKLGVDFVDLFLIHSPIETSAETEWPVLEALQREGKARSIGVSNFRIKDFEVVARVGTVVPAINQIEIHPYLLDTLKPLLAYQAEKGIASAAYGPLSTLFRYGGGPVDAVVSKLAKARNVTEGNILLRWALQTGGGEIVTTSAKKDRLVEQFKTFEFELSEDEVKEIDRAGLAGKHQRTWMQHMDTDE